MIVEFGLLSREKKLLERVRTKIDGIGLFFLMIKLTVLFQQDRQRSNTKSGQKL